MAPLHLRHFPFVERPACVRGRRFARGAPEIALRDDDDIAAGGQVYAHVAAHRRVEASPALDRLRRGAMEDHDARPSFVRLSGPQEVGLGRHSGFDLIDEVDPFDVVRAIAPVFANVERRPSGRQRPAEHELRPPPAPLLHLRRRDRADPRRAVRQDRWRTMEVHGGFLRGEAFP